MVFPFLAACGKKEEAVVEVGTSFESPWPSEEQWMVSSVVADLQGICALAGGKAAEGSVTAGKVDHEFQVGGVTLKMSPSCWDTASYQALLESWKPAPQSAAGPAPDLVHDLLTPTATGLQKANDAISARIAAAPADPLVHEEAAFLLGVFGIRENACQFGDLRPLVCRMTAHLAIASHLRKGAEPSTVGQWARVFYEYHTGRRIKARELAASMPAEGDGGRWKRVVEMLVTGDWRRAGDLDNPSLAEAIAISRAFQAHRGNPLMIEFLKNHKGLQEIPEWSRALSGPGKSVGDGRLAMNSALVMEFREIAEIFHTGEQPKPEKLAHFIGQEAPSRLVVGSDGPRVISNADWAAYFRRHLYYCSADIARFCIRKWGSMEGAVAWQQTVAPYFRKLPDHELIEPLVATKNADYQTSLKTTAEFIRHHPEKVPNGVWFDYRFPALEKVSAETRMPSQTPWFREVSPPGTAYDPTRRIRYEGIQGSTWVDHIKALHAVDPWNSELCYEMAENTGNNIESVKNAWGDLSEYSIRPLNQTLQGPKLTSDERIETLRTLFKIEPSAGLDLGEALVIAGRPEEAVAPYEGAFRDDADRVRVANTTRWLIYHYKSTGQDAKAREVADHNAEVFSARGLDSALALAIEEKDFKRAKKIAADIAERYDDPTYIPIAAWYAGGDKKALTRVFPDGLKEVAAADFDGSKPVKGIRIDSNSSVTRAVGLKAGDVILAIDGKRLETMPQYYMVLSSQLGPQTRIIYRRGKKIEEVGCQLPDRRLGVDVHVVGELAN
ncbi:MAG: PDZ domain-containing protein [Luteolibacter sp.]